MKKSLIIVSVLALLFAVSCSKGAASEEKKGAKNEKSTILKEVKIIKPLKLTKELVVKEGVTLSPEEKGAVTAEVGGKLNKWLVEEHQRVKKGQSIAVLESLDYEISVEQAKSNLAALEAQFAGVEKDYGRIKELFAKNAIPKQQMDSVETQYNALSKQIESGKKSISLITRRLEKTVIKAPFDGVITYKKVPLGYSVMIAMPDSGDIAGIEKTDRLKVSINLSEIYFSEIEKDDEIEFFIPSLNKTAKGKIHSKGTTINAMKKFNIIVLVDNKKGEIPAGSFGVATLKSKAKERILVPPTAVKVTGEKTGEIYTLKDGKVEAVIVYVGFPFEEGLEIAGIIPDMIVSDASTVKAGESVGAANK